MTQPVVYNLGSLNIDRVFRVPHVVRPGETLASTSLSEFAGGKGANQSVALARAGARVVHVGKVGADGVWLRDKLAADGVDVRGIFVGHAPTGQAIIQVDDAGQNSIVLLAGANNEISPAEIDDVLRDAAPGSWLLTQNETSAVAHAMQAAHDRGLKIAFNPAPLNERVAEYPLELVDLLCVNETEAAGLKTVGERLKRAETLLTLGSAGAMLKTALSESTVPGQRVTAIDTTAAGDTFLGYFLAARLRGLAADQCLQVANRAAAICVTRAGAMDSIPTWAEVVGA